MRRYDDSVEVRRGLVDGMEAPEQFVWRGGLWLVRAVVAHWIETGTWWEQPTVRALLGTDTGDTKATIGSASAGDLVREREVWRVEAARGRAGQAGVFDLSLDWTQGQWRLVCAHD